MNRLSAILILFSSITLLACQLEYILPKPAPSSAPRATRTKTPGAAQPEVPTAAPQVPPGVLPGGSAPVVVTVKENLRVRAAPSTTAQIIDQLNKGDKAQVTGTNAPGDWFQIMLPSNPNARGWILASFTEVSGPVDTLPVVPSGPVPAPQPYPGQAPLPPPQPYP